MKTKIQYTLAAFLLLPAALTAQTQNPDTTLNRTVVVEQEYAPHLRDASKVNVLPRVDEPQVTPRQVEYDIALSPAAQIPADTMQAFAADEVPEQATPGYVRAGYGNYNNLDVYANYLFRLSSADRLGLTFSMDGMDGKLDWGDDAPKWNAFDHRTRAAVDYTHRFGRLDLNVAGHFGLRNFNLLPDSYAGKQKFTSGDVHLGVASTAADLPVQYRAETNLMLYQRQHGPDYDDAQEVLARTKADVWGIISEGQSVGLALQMDNAVYSKNDFDNYTALSLTPYYQYKNDRWDIRAGVHVDPAFGFTNELCVSPDVRVQYAFPANAVLYLQATGGRLLNDFRRLESVSPYAEPAGQLAATYEQVNAALGVKWGTAWGYWMHLFGGYQNLQDDVFYCDLPVGTSAYALGLGTWDTDNFYFGAELSYDYRDIFRLSAQSIYRSWDTDVAGKEMGVLAFKPAVTFDFKLDIHPVRPLRVHVGYRKVTRTEVEGERINPIDNLYAGATYDLFPGIGVYARLDNLLNKTYQYDWFRPTEGFNLVGGVTFRF